MNAIVMYRIERWLYLHHLTILAKIVKGGGISSVQQFYTVQL